MAIPCCQVTLSEIFWKIRIKWVNKLKTFRSKIQSVRTGPMAEKGIGFEFARKRIVLNFTSEINISLKYMERLEKCENDRRDLYKKK